MYFFLNVYSDDQQNTLKYLKSTEVNLNNILIMIGDLKSEIVIGIHHTHII